MGIDKAMCKVTSEIPFFDNWLKLFSGWDICRFQTKLILQTYLVVSIFAEDFKMKRQNVHNQGENY